MLQVVRKLFVIPFSILAVYILITTGFNNNAHAQSHGFQGTIQGLFDEQEHLLKSELRKSGVTLTPENMKLIQASPEFKGISKEEIVKGKSLLKTKEVEEEKRKKQGEVTSKKAIKTESLFDRYREKGPYQDISTDLKPFGYAFFAQALERTLMPRKDVPVSSDYIIGPGDEVQILLWGRVNAQYDLTINNDGEIIIPGLGPLHIAGMTFDKMKSYLTDRTNKIVGAKINVTMGTLKSIQVFVLGEVKRPGSYSLNSFSTITNAILTSGGPSAIGSLRNIKLKRDDRTIAEMDFYDFLLNGNKSQDRNLQSGDVVFVSTVGPLVGIAGNVKRPAIYELKNKYDLMNLFNMAGGVIPSAYTQQIQVERIIRNENQMVVDINDKDLTKAKDFILQDGDLVKVFSIVDRDVNVVMLNGNVKRPGKYEYKTGMRVKDLIKDTSDVLKETYFEYALIKRMKPPSLKTELIPFSLGKLLFDNDDANNIRLEPKDSIYIFSKWVFKDKPRITVDGEVRKKGSFDLLDNYKVRDAILEAGGLSRDASLQKGEIFRTDDYGQVKQIYFDVDRAMAEDPEENLLLLDRDRVIIHSIWEKRYKHTVSIDGDIKKPGEYPLAEDMSISDLVFAAGNILESAYLDEAELSSFTVDNGKRFRTDYKVINLGLAMSNDTSHNLLLKPYDRVFVKRIPEWQEKKFVSISGEVNFPGRYIIKKEERLTSLIERAGGYSNRAYLRGAVFTREDVRELQQKSMDEMVERLERELLTEGSVQVATALSTEEVEAKKVELEQQQEFIGSLKHLKATGRMSIRLAHLRLLKNSEYDIELKEGDTLNIPTRKSVVNVVGSVMSRGSFIFSKKLTYKHYIEMAGGFTRYADEKNVYVLKVDGTAMKLSKGLASWNSPQSRWELNGFGKNISVLEAGDSIIVPEKLDRIAWLREVKDITQILFQIATTAGVMVLLF